MNEARNLYYKEYRKKNKERIKKINERYWQKKNQQLKQAKEQTNHEQ